VAENELVKRARPTIQIGSGAPVQMKPGAKYQHTASGKVDICFVFDTTGSMSDKIDGLVASTAELVADLAAMAIDWRVTTVPFGDLTIPGDRVVTDQPFVNSREAAQAQLRSMPRFSGGGNTGESSLEAINAALDKTYRSDAVKVIVLITDEPALGDRFSIVATGQHLRGAEVICFVASPDLPYYRSWAANCGGTWTLIGSSMDNRELRRLLRSLVGDVAKVARDVNVLAGGSVRKFLALGGRAGRSDETS
jgi:hypothetical protein